MIVCEECSHDPIPNCSLCEEIRWLHKFRMENATLKQPPYKMEEEE